jgi:hypothetical protein
MRKSFLSIFIIVITIINSFGQDIPSDPNGPEIKFSKLIHDYGTIIQGADGNCEFKFKNTGKEPLILSSVTSTCGCTVPLWSREPIMPGKEGIIKVKYDTIKIGIIGKPITVISNAKTDRVVLQITGKIEAKPID